MSRRRGGGGEVRVGGGGGMRKRGSAGCIVPIWHMSDLETAGQTTTGLNAR
jgi:hypothetical protein